MKLINILKIACFVSLLACTKVDGHSAYQSPIKGHNGRKNPQFLRNLKGKNADSPTNVPGNLLPSDFPSLIPTAQPTSTPSINTSPTIVNGTEESPGPTSTYSPTPIPTSPPTIESPVDAPTGGPSGPSESAGTPAGGGLDALEGAPGTSNSGADSNDFALALTLASLATIAFL